MNAFYYSDCPLRPRRAGGRKNKFRLISKRPVNILKAAISSAWSRHRCSLSSYGRWCLRVTNIVANLWTRSRWLISATRFGEQAGILYSRWGRTKVPYKGMKADFERPWKERLIMKINRLALFSVSVHWAEGGNILSVWTLRSSTNLYAGMVVPDPSGRKDNLRTASRPILRWLHLVGLIGRSHFWNQSHATAREPWRFVSWVLRVTILTSSAKNSISASRTSGRNRCEPNMEPCGIQLCIGMASECSPPTYTLKTRALILHQQLHSLT